MRDLITVRLEPLNQGVVCEKSDPDNGSRLPLSGDWSCGAAAVAIAVAAVAAVDTVAATAESAAGSCAAAAAAAFVAAKCGWSAAVAAAGRRLRIAPPR